MRSFVRTATAFAGAVAVAALMVPAHAQTPTATPTSTTPAATASPIPEATATPSPAATPEAAPTAEETPITKRVTATYECGAAHFTNPLTDSVLVIYGTAQTDDVEGRITLAPGETRTVQSTNKAFGWTAWADGDQSRADVGHRWLPGEDLSCDEPDDSTTPTPTTVPGESRGLANTGV